MLNVQRSAFSFDKSYQRCLSFNDGTLKVDCDHQEALWICQLCILYMNAQEPIMLGGNKIPFNSQFLPEALQRKLAYNYLFSFQLVELASSFLQKKMRRQF